jgi:amidase
MHGIPILVKDNVEVAGPLPTTAGSLALAGNVTNRDAPLIARLRAAGAVILGKTNLSEWANIRSDNSTSGWSAVQHEEIMADMPWMLIQAVKPPAAGSEAPR